MSICIPFDVDNDCWSPEAEMGTGGGVGGTPIVNFELTPHHKNFQNYPPHCPSGPLPISVPRPNLLRPSHIPGTQ